MRYYFKLSATQDLSHDAEYYNEHTIRNIPIYPATPELDRIAEEDPRADLWPICNPYDYSGGAIDCKDRDEAYRYLLESENLSLYEYKHDL